MSTEEIDVWIETASMRDFFVNPKHWLLTLCTLGAYAVVVYLSRYYTRFRLTNQRLIKESGLLAKRIDEIELFRLKDSRLRQTFLQRIVGLGDIEVLSVDPSGSFWIENVPGAHKKREQLRTMASRARESAGIRMVINE